MGTSNSSYKKWIGTFDKKNLLNSILYEVEVSDGSIKLYVENTISQNIHSKIGADSYSHTILDTISRTIRQSPNIKSLY